MNNKKYIFKFINYLYHLINLIMSNNFLLIKMIIHVLLLVINNEYGY